MAKLFKKESAGSTLIEVLCAMLLAVIVLFMMSDLVLLISGETLPFLTKSDNDILVVSALEHMEANMGGGIAWKKHERQFSPINDIDVFVPDPNNFNDRLSDKKIRYRFDMSGVGDGENEGTVTFYSDVTSVPESQRWTPGASWLANGYRLVTGVKEAYISPQDPNAREVYIELKSGVILCKTIRLKSLW